MSLVAKGLARPPMLAPTDLTLARGELVGLIGPNGAGKTTLLRALAGLSRCKGETRVNGKPLVPNPKGLAWLPADRDIAWPMRAADLVQLGLGPGAPPDPQAVTAALAMTDAAAFADRRVDTLSTGERARVLLARALVARPDWLLLDEPVANFDPGHRLDLMALLAREAARGAGLIVALHDLDLARRFCRRLLLIDGGRVVADGPAEAVLSEAHLAAVFGIRPGASGWERTAPAGG